MGDFMKEKQTANGTALGAELRRYRIKATVARLIAYGAAAVALLLFLRGQILAAVICLLLAIVGACRLSTHTEALKKSLSDNVVAGVLKEAFGNVEYNPFGHLPDETVSGAGMVFPFSFERIRGSDHVKAEYRGLHVELSDIELYHRTESYNSERDTWEESEEKVFKGQWLVCDFGRALSGEVHLSENTKPLRKMHRDDRIEMENPAFNDRFFVTAADAQEAYYVLTPHMMEYILAAAGKSGGEVYMSFLRGGRLHVAVNTGKDFFELGAGSADVEALRRKFSDELHWFTDIIDTLRLDDHLYSKEVRE